MKIALVGSSGYIASFLLKRLAQEGKIEDVLKIDQNNEADEFLDLQMPEKFNHESLKEIEFVVFTAAVSGPDKCANEFCWNINVIGINYFIRKAGLIEPKVMVGNLKSPRTYADVRDAVRAYYMLVTVNPVAGEYYNIGGSYTCEVGDTLDTLISYSTMKDKIQIEIDPERLRPIDADLQVPDCKKFKDHTGWQPQISFEQTMHDLLDYWRVRVNKGECFLTR